MIRGLSGMLVGVLLMGVAACSEQAPPEPDPMAAFDGYKTIGVIKDDIVMRLQDFKQYTPEEVMEKFEGKEVTIVDAAPAGTNGGLDTRHNMCWGYYTATPLYSRTIPFDKDGYDLSVMFNHPLDDINDYRALVDKLPPLPATVMDGAIEVPHPICEDKCAGTGYLPGEPGLRPCQIETLTHRPNVVYSGKIVLVAGGNSKRVFLLPTGIRYPSYQGD